MRTFASAPLVTSLASVALGVISCGGTVTIDSGSSAGGASATGANGATTMQMSATQTVGATTGTGMCRDPGAPQGAQMGISDCGMHPCSASGASCVDVCSALYDCADAKCGPGGAQLCPDFPNDAMSHDFWSSNGCVGQCMTQPLLKQLVDPTDCGATIQAVRSAWPHFGQLCSHDGAG